MPKVDFTKSYKDVDLTVSEEDKALMTEIEEQPEELPVDAEEQSLEDGTFDEGEFIKLERVEKQEHALRYIAKENISFHHNPVQGGEEPPFEISEITPENISELVYFAAKTENNEYFIIVEKDGQFFSLSGTLFTVAEAKSFLEIDEFPDYVRHIILVDGLYEVSADDIEEEIQELLSMFREEEDDDEDEVVIPENDWKPVYPLTFVLPNGHEVSFQTEEDFLEVFEDLIYQVVYADDVDYISIWTDAMDEFNDLPQHFGYDSLHGYFKQEGDKFAAVSEEEYESIVVYASDDDAVIENERSMVDLSNKVQTIY